jgi:hypothetical protein
MLYKNPYRPGGWKPLKRLSIIGYSLAMVLLGMPGAFAAAYSEVLSSEAIADRAEQVARQNNTSGRCYAAVSKALKPLGVNLYGQSAYEAKALLLKDSRFVPLAVTHVDQLARGDVIVYQKSQSHPHGHISVYQGNYIEASDNISSVKHTREYGGATVFRLRDEIATAPVPRPAPDRLTYQPPQPEPPPAVNTSIARHYGINKKTIGRALIRAGIRYLLGG